MKKGIALLLAVLMLFELAACSSSSGRDDSEEEEEIVTESETLSAENPAATLCGVTIDADTYNLKDGDLKAEITDYGTNTTPQGEAYREYEITLGKQSEYYAAATLTFPCENPEDCVVLHQDHETGQWMPMICFPDEEKETITVYTDSFSSFRVQEVSDAALFVVVDEGTPNATVAVSPTAIQTLESMSGKSVKKMADLYVEDPQNYKLDVDDSSVMKDFLQNSAGPLAEVVGNTAELNMTPIEFVMNNSIYEYTGTAFKEDLNNLMTGLSLATIGLQLARDVKQNGMQSETTTANLMKNMFSNTGTFYSLGTGYSSTAFTFTFFGVALIGMGLDNMTATAKGEQAKYMKKLMDYYYEDVKPFDADEWYEKFNHICRDRHLTTEEAVAAITAELDAYSAEFWTVMAQQSGKDYEDLMLEAGIKNIYELDDSQKQQLTQFMKYTVRQKFNDEVMPKIEKDVVAQQQAQIITMLQDLTKPFNQRLTFNVMERVDMETSEETQYNACTIAFGKGDSVQKGDGWLLQAPESASDEWNDGWEVSLTATDYAWMCAGIPDTVFVYADESDVGGEPMTTMTFSQPHNTRNRSVDIDLGSSATYVWTLRELSINPNYEAGDPEKVTGWSGDIVNLYVTWQEKLDGKTVTYTDTTFSAGQSMDYPSDFRFVCLYDESTETYSERSHKSSVSILSNGKKTSVSKSGYVEDGETGHDYTDEDAFPKAAAGKTFTVTVNRGIYSLVYNYMAVPAEEKDNYVADIVNNCPNEPDENGALVINGTWAIENPSEDEVASTITFLLTDTMFQIENITASGVKSVSGTPVGYTFENNTLTVDGTPFTIRVVDENHIIMNWGIENARDVALVRAS